MQGFRVRGLLAAAITICVWPQAGAADEREPAVLGWLEHGRLMPMNLKLDAKLDSGARTTSLHAEILRGAKAERVLAEEEVDGADRKYREGTETVVFRVTNEEGERVHLKRKVVRWVAIKSRGEQTVERPVVVLEFCIAGLRVRDEVNLADRSKFNYPLLVGRNMLEEGGILVDAGDIYTRSSRCLDETEDEAAAAKARAERRSAALDAEPSRRADDVSAAEPAPAAGGADPDESEKIEAASDAASASEPAGAQP